MAHDLHDTIDFGKEGVGEKDVDETDLSRLKYVFRKHESNGSISNQINECLKKDGINLTMLSEFDDYSLKEIIDSWHLNTFNQKPFLIRALLINAIKKLRSLTNYNVNVNGSAKALKSATRNVVLSETEVKLWKSLQEFEKSIINEIKLFETRMARNKNTINTYDNERTPNEYLLKPKDTENKSDDADDININLFDKYHHEIEQVFNQLTNDLN